MNLYPLPFTYDRITTIAHRTTFTTYQITIMKYLLLISILLLSGCTQYQNIETCTKQEIIKTEVTGKSWSDESQWAGAAGWIEVWGMVWCMIGWPIGCVVWGVIWWLWWAGAGSMDSAIDYTVTTSSWNTFVCQEKSCQSITWDTYKTDWKTIEKCIYTRSEIITK